MFRMKKFVYGILLWLSFTAILKAQSNTGLNSGDSTGVSLITEASNESFSNYLPPLSVLIDSAVANAADVDVLKYIVKAREYKVGEERKDWSELLYVDGQYRYNRYDELVFDQTGIPQPQRFSGYQVAAGVRIPLSYFVGRKDRIKELEMNVKTAEAEQRKKEDEVREAVISTYNRLLLLQELIKITTQAKQSTDLILEMAEDRFRDGELTIEDLGSSTHLRAQYAVQYETYISEFRTTYALLERLVGVPFAKLQNLNE